nr:MAG TPA: hypothetical protein [Caudoviricetes sp.]
MHRCNHINIDLVSSSEIRTKHTTLILLNCCPAVGLTDTQTGLSGGTLQQKNFIICTTPVKLSPVRHQCRGMLMP